MHIHLDCAAEEKQERDNDDRQQKDNDGKVSQDNDGKVSQDNDGKLQQDNDGKLQQDNDDRQQDRMAATDDIVVTDSPSTPFVGGRKGVDKYRFTILTDGLFRYEWAPDGEFEDRPSSFAANRAQAVRSVPKYRVRESGEALEVVTSRFHLTYNKKEFSAYGLFVVVFNHTGTTWRFGEQHETLGGTRRTLDGVDGRADLDPGVTSRKGFANLDDSKSFLFTDDGFVATRRPGADRVDGYLFCYGHDYRDAVSALYRLSGPQPLLPRWTLGNWWSRYYEYTADSYLELMDTFDKHKIPLAVGVLDMDWHWVDDERVKRYRASGWTGYSWNTKLFPDPPSLIKKLHERKLKVTVNDHPADGVQPYEDQYEAVAKALHRDPAKREGIPFDITDRAYLDAYFDPLLRPLKARDGVDFFWVDWQQGTQSGIPGVDPLWMLNHFHYAKWSGPGRPLVLSRYAGPGSHRYPIGFSGDTVVSWDSLRFQPEFTATASNIGFGIWSHDIGGHMLGTRIDDLTTRWVQLGVFSPIFRLHSTKNRWVAKEPWKLPPGPRESITAFMRLRHRLIPYLHSMNARAADRERGEPLVQPMYWGHPEREEAYGVPNQYYFGSEMVVAPITSPQNGATHTGKVRAWLPPGTFVDLFSGLVYDGDRSLWLSRTLDRMPVLLRQGAIVPLDGAAEPANGGRNPERLEVVAVVGADGSFEMLEEAEDGEGNGAAGDKVEWARTPMAFSQAEGVLKIGPTQGRRSWAVRLLGYGGGKEVRAAVGERRVEARLTAADNGLVVEVGEAAAGSLISVSLGFNPQLAVKDPVRLMDPILFGAEVQYQLKERIDGIMSARSEPKSNKASQLDALDMDQDLRLVLTEFLFADSRSP
ncbi:hypothetical protein CDD83_776 [Cordyceps sp. RAO-2017]|nr:hypothetical protein CDD83_776 [Cordyceps sp. RAO-2017]